MNALEEKKRYFATKNNRPSTFQEYLEYWFWEVFFPKCTSRSVQMKNFWIIYYVIRPQTLPDCPLDKLDQRYLDTLLENCQKYCQCAGYTVYKFLTIVLSQACMEGFLPELISPRNEYPVPDSDIRLYNKEQLKRFLLAIKKDPRGHMLEYYLALFCGLRPGEILALRYENYDPNMRTLFIREEYTKEDHLPGMKTPDQSVTYCFRHLNQAEHTPFHLKVPEFICRQLNERIWQNEQFFHQHPNRENPKAFCLSARGTIKVLPTLNVQLKQIAKENALPSISMLDLRYMHIYLLMQKGLDYDDIATSMHLSPARIKYLCLLILDNIPEED